MDPSCPNAKTIFVGIPKITRHHHESAYSPHDVDVNISHRSSCPFVGGMTINHGDLTRAMVACQWPWGPAVSDIVGANMQWSVKQGAFDPSVVYRHT